MQGERGKADNSPSLLSTLGRAARRQGYVMNTTQPHINCLILLQTFEIYWAYYSVSDGRIYANAARKSAGALCAAVRETASADPGILNPDVLLKDGDVEPGQIIDLLEKWSTGNELAPMESMFTSIRRISSFFLDLKNYLLEKGKIPSKPVMQINREELMFREGVERWQAHLPTMLVMGQESPEELIKRAGESDTIAVVGDIKHMQDLITYALDPDSFFSFTVRFIERTRMLADEYMGIFDRYTGNGFIVYFNRSICQRLNLDLGECFLNFVKDELAFSRELFEEWGQKIRKRSPDPLGLSIGADFGKVSFQDLAGQLVAAGEPLTWAWRLAGIGRPGETLINNLMNDFMQDRSGLSSRERLGETKSGEQFMARVLAWS